jgi:thymidylate kinase
MEQAGEEFFTNVIKGFDELAEKEGRFVIIDASQEKEVIHEEIFGVLKHRR